MEYFWYHRPNEDHPPRVIRPPEEIENTDRLAVACTQTDLSVSRQKALVREWCHLLPALSGVRLLWLTSRVPQLLFEAACEMQDLEGLSIKWSAIKSLDPLPTAARLRFLHLGSSPILESIEPLARCEWLRVLGLENIKRISRLDPLGELKNLEQLALDAVYGQRNTWTSSNRSESFKSYGICRLSTSERRTARSARSTR